MPQGPSLAPAYSFLRACRSEPISETPIWIMRQAGRYLPEYRAIREKHSFLEVCRTPELCAEVTAQPIERFGFDAAILFSDILIPLIAMGVPIEFDPGPKIGTRIARRGDIAALEWSGPSSVAHVRPVVKAVKDRLHGRVPLIGFAGAPFTLASYLIDANGSKDLMLTRSFLSRDTEGFAELLDLLATATIDYLKEQIAAGVDAVMLFDTQAGWLPPAEFTRSAAAPAERILREIPKSTPTIYFALASSNGQLDAMRAIRADVIGLDYRVSLSQARAILGGSRSVQGNLDPAVLLGPPEQVVTRAEAVLRENGGRPGFIFNLGHGIYPETPVENVELLVSTVKRHRNSAGGVL
ncbi:MAG: uroporphyrinogen decarboxylase [Candidatus Eisenbacteria bacterium]|uniref:Uroporphyrinogen decarboxylase n=1 Tax=Eiseniibacteriota bacterium TaxID=2212470 RepID=A0A538TCP0_UNCEI|nr:MAG: uroporphyrinogen decarboxylase [Candidatus Eisenbacteria bacterium]